MECKMSLDNISFTAKLHYGDDTPMNEYLSSNYLEEAPDYWYSPKNFLYQHNFKFPDGSFFQYGEFQNDHHARLEFNPNKCNHSIIYRIIKRLKYPKVTRIDFACDYFDKDLSKLKFDSVTARSQEEIRSRSGLLETLYIGSRRSDKFIRIYNKAKEQAKHRKLDPDDEIETNQVWWRVEAVVKDFSDLVEHEYDDIDENGKPIKVKKKIKKEGDLFKNPFTVTLSEKKETMKVNLKVAEKAMLYYLAHHPEAWEELSPNSRRKYSDMDFAYSYDLMENQPHEIFEQEKNRLQTELETWLKPAIDNGTYLTGRTTL